MQDMPASFICQLIGAVMIIGAGFVVLGIPFAIWESLFGPIGGDRGDDGPYRSDRSAQELYERRTRDSHRR